MSTPRTLNLTYVFYDPSTGTFSRRASVRAPLPADLDLSGPVRTANTPHITDTLKTFYRLDQLMHVLSREDFRALCVRANPLVCACGKSLLFHTPPFETSYRSTGFLEVMEDTSSGPDRVRVLGYTVYYTDTCDDPACDTISRKAHKSIMRARRAENPGAVQLKTCAYCRVVKEGMKKCGGCGFVSYCGQECQRRDWKKHRPECKNGGVCTDNDA